MQIASQGLDDRSRHPSLLQHVQKSYLALCGFSLHVPGSNVGSQHRPQDQDEGHNHKERLLPGILSPVPILNCSWSRLTPHFRAALCSVWCKMPPASRSAPCINTGKLGSRGRLPLLCVVRQKMRQPSLRLDLELSFSCVITSP
jgi:hypothetical protein